MERRLKHDLPGRLGSFPEFPRIAESLLPDPLRLAAWPAVGRLFRCAVLAAALVAAFGGMPAAAQPSPAADSRAARPGPMSPDLRTSQVDLMWNVVPDKVTEDNYGSYISGRYYVIDIVIGNNSGYELYLVTVGFERKSPAPPTAEEQRSGRWLIPANGYKMVRGSLERAQEFGTRSKAVSGIKAAGLIAAGFTPFFHNVGHAGNWSKGVNLFSDPVEKGFELVVPDRTTRYLARLDDQALKDGMLISHNHQERTRVYVAKVSLYAKKAESDPDKVKETLGRMVLVGKVLTDVSDFASREHVVQDTAPAANPTPVANPAPATGGAPNPAATPGGATPAPKPGSC